jgi:NADH-quinone oxidoreductase subunit H
MFEWIQSNVPPWFFIASVSHLGILLTVAYLILLERKTASWVQDRIGPNRVGPWGLLQPIADGLKFILKEDYQPKGVDKYIFTIAPAMMILVMIISIAIIPWAGTKQSTRTVSVTQEQWEALGTEVSGGRTRTAEAIAKEKLPWGVELQGTPVRAGDASNPQATLTYRYPFQVAKLNIAALFVIAILSLAVYGIVLGGWASNNKYSFLGGLRATAQMISYEIPLGLSLLVVVLLTGTLEFGEIVEKQAHYWGKGIVPAWNVFHQPVAFLMFLTCIHAEANRAPFDMAEAEQELVGGYHTEYSSMRFALFFLAEYAGMITTSAICVALFFGGWHFWGLNGPDPANPGITDSFVIIALRCLVFFLKTIFIVFVFMWVRWSLPRFRFDQLMMLAWRSMIPLSLALLMVTAVVLYVMGPRSEMFVKYRFIDGWTALVFLVVNVMLIGVTAFVSTILPLAPETNRRIPIPNSRFNRKPAATPAATPIVVTPAN